MTVTIGGLFFVRVQNSDTQTLLASDSFEQIGSTLKEARQAQGLKINDVSQQLRISVDYLSKLELGAFDELPAPAYVCLLYTSPSPRDATLSRMPSSA